MSEEIFDVVNERNEVIGRRPRAEVHRLKLRHRAAHLLVFNSRGQLFLQKRSMQKDCHPGVWDSSASGHLNAGESYEACVIREAKEELGLILAAPPLLLFKIDACEQTGWEFAWIYRAESEGPFTLQAEEIETGAWYAPECISDWMQREPVSLAPSFQVIWNKWIQ